MSQGTKYSICATHYNNIDYIRKSIGVLAAEIEGKDDWEIVVVDAGSDDGSLEYLQNISREQSNVCLVIEEGVNIGEGRQIAVQNAAGEIMIQIMDLDAEYYGDGRIFEITGFYETLLESGEEVQLSAGAYFSTMNLMDELGGWKNLAANEETELKRRALRQGKLRFCPVYLYKEHSDEKGFFGSIERFYYNSYAKFEAGVGFWYMLFYWLRNARGIKPRLGALVIFPLARIKLGIRYKPTDGSYKKHDPYIMDFQKAVFDRHPELWIEPPENLKSYVIPQRWEYIQGE